MSSYFDMMSRRVSELETWVQGDVAFVERVASIEKDLYGQVVLITGDREFPDDLRQKILGALAVESVYQPNGLAVLKRAEEFVSTTRSSLVIDTIHELFHDLARRRIETRFGRLSDDPVDMLSRREEHDAGSGDHA